MSDELYSNVLNDIVAILNEDTALSRDKKIHEIMRAFIMGLCGEPEMVKAIMYSGINAVSYTHLDVYKRQISYTVPFRQMLPVP